MTRSLTANVGGLARRALLGEGGGSDELASSRAERAIRIYLSDSSAERVGWRVPSLAGEPREAVKLRLSLDEDLCVALEAEAAAQQVSVDRLVEHALLYYAAEVDAGRIAQRIVEGLDEEE